MSLIPEYPFFIIFLFFFFFLSILFPCFLSLPHPDAATIHPIFPNPSPPSTIPAFPEQSAVAGCSLNLSDELFHAVNAACGAAGAGAGGELHRSRCCPVLAAWLYSAYSGTALSTTHFASSSSSSSSYDMPLLPDDSETCVNGLGKALKSRGIKLIQPNETCDLVYCYCGIRLHPMSCPEAFSMTHDGKISGDRSVKRLERNCLSTSNNVDKFPGLGGCSKCLNSLYKLTKKKASNSSKSEDRTTKIHNKDCELMGLTWLLAKNQTAYMHTVSGVLRALMFASDPISCTLNSDGMPLAVDSSVISDYSSSIHLQSPIFLCCFFLLLICLLLQMHVFVLQS